MFYRNFIRYPNLKSWKEKNTTQMVYLLFLWGDKELNACMLTHKFEDIVNTSRLTRSDARYTYTEFSIHLEC